MKDTLTVELTEEEVAFLRDLLFAYDDNAQSLDEMYLNLIEKIDFNQEEEENRMSTKFKKGQKVWVKGHNDPDLTHHYAIGDHVIIDKLDDVDDTLLCSRVPDGVQQWVSVCDVQRRKTK